MGKILFILLLLGGGYWAITNYNIENVDDVRNLLSDRDEVQAIEALVRNHAQAWEIYDEDLFLSTVHADIIFAYPGRRLNYDELLEDYRAYHDMFEDTKIYISEILVDGDMVAVEWQFAATKREDGVRTAVSDAIIGKIADNKIVLWKEYLDGRVTRMQAVNALPLEEGEEPFPSPMGSLRPYCEVACAAQ